MKSSKEFLQELAEELRYLPAKQVNEVLKHYRDKINVEIDYGTPVEKVLESMKSPSEIAKSIYEMHGVNYLAKRKKHTKIKDGIGAGISGIILVCCLILYFSIAYFFVSIMVNQFGLIINAFSFNSILDTILTSLCVFSYILIMLVVLLLITDLFMILMNGLFIKILDAFDKTRGKNFTFLEFTFTGWLNDKTKKQKFVYKLLGGLVIAFVLFGVCSYFTNGYINRTLRNVPSKEVIVEINQEFDNIYISSNEVDVSIVEDVNVTKPTIKYIYEFNKYQWTIIDNTLKITIDKNKTYDFLGIIQAPSSTITLSVPKDYDCSNILVEVNYGDVYIKQLDVEKFNVSLLNGNVILGDNNFIRSEINLSTGNIVSKGNKYEELTINHHSGELNSGEDYVSKLTHNNGSSNIKTVGSTILSYQLVNSSGSVYLEDVKGDTINIKTNSSVNKLYDIYYCEAKFEIDSACNFNVTRSYFSEKLETLSNNKSYQTYEYVKAPYMEIKGLDGTIICGAINTNYGAHELSQFDETYIQRAKDYNNVTLQTSEVRIISYDADISLDELTADKLYLEQTRHLSVIENVNIKTSELIFLSAVSNINEFYAEQVDIKIDSRNLTDKASIDINNKNESSMVVNLEKDGISEFNTSDNFGSINYE